jgi:hypothetical protein
MRRAKLTVHSADFILKEGVLPVIVVEPYSPAFKAVIERLTADPMLQVVEINNYNDASGVARKVGQCLILFHCPNSKDVNDQLHFLKSLSKELQSKSVRAVMTINVLSQVPIDSRLEVYGCSEIVREPVPEKSLVFKLEKHIRNLLQSQKTTIRAAQAAASNSENVNFVENRELSTAALETIRLDPELKLESDFWLLAGGGAKIVGGKWAVRLVGPGPMAGHWLKSDLFTESTGDSNYWQWKPAQVENDPFIKGQGTWIFKGQRPEFQLGFWNFVSKNPELFFYHDDEKKGSKVRMDESDALCVAKDSAISREFLALIKSSANKKLSSKTDDKKVKASGPIRARDALIKGPAEDNNNPGRTTLEAPPYRLVQPLTTKSDCWLLQKRRPRWIGGRWVIKLLGPGAVTGNWVPYTMPGNYSGMLKDGDEKFWQWVPTAGADNFIVDAGSWIFFGLMPRVEEDCWLFVGKNILLSFIHDQVNKGDRVKVDANGTLLVAWDSEHAKELLPKLEKAQVEVIRLEKAPKPTIVAAAIKTPALAPRDEILAAAETVKASGEEESEPILAEEVSKPHEENELSEPIMAAKVPEIPIGLSLSPMAFSLIVSELAATQKNTRAVVGRKISGYLSSTCNGSRVEIWKKDKESQWVCVATHDGTSGRFEDDLKKVDMRYAREVNGKGVAPVFADIHHPEKIVGAVVVDDMQNSKVTLNFLQAVAQATCTVIK